MTTEIPMSVKFLKATLILFFERVEPLSKHMKPACMRKTSPAQMSTQIASSIDLSMTQIPRLIQTVAVFIHCNFAEYPQVSMNNLT